MNPMGAFLDVIHHLSGDVHQWVSLEIVSALMPPLTIQGIEASDVVEEGVDFWESLRVLKVSSDRKQVQAWLP